jgi:beta-glucanase (GH16 family)
MRYLSLLLIALITINGSCQTQAPAPTPPVAQGPSTPAKLVKYTFSETPVWRDEFDYTGKPEPAKWDYDLGGNGWGNNEMQNYTNNSDNAYVKGGHLTIKAIKEPSGGRLYSSARLVTKGKGDFLYGKFEIRAKLPSGKGTWPAIWMLASQSDYGSQFWPDNGELDIMEHVGFDQNIVHANIHTKAFNHSIGTNKGDKIAISNASSEFHVYTCEWRPDYITFAVDGKDYFRFSRDYTYSWQQWPFNKKFHLLMNIAIGGNWGGQEGLDNSIFPQSMEIDYVRVYELVEKK